MIATLNGQLSANCGQRAEREYQPSPALSRRLALEGIQSFSLFELPSGLRHAERFRSMVVDARASHGALGACLHLYRDSEYTAMRLFSDADGMAGFALNGQEVVSVFCHKDRRKRHATRTMMELAVMLGGIFLNAFDTFLPAVYGRCGFKPVARMAWDDHQAPDGWDYEAALRFSGGRPDVVFMTYTSRRPTVARVGSFEAGELLQRLAANTDFIEVTL